VIGTGGETNTPANEYWYLSLGYSLETDLDTERIINIYYYSTNGSVDLTRTSAADMSQANNLVQPLLSTLQSRTNSSMGIWNVLNALFVGYYWFILFDLGQTRLQIYYNPDQYLIPQNFSQLISYSSTNNVILNSSLNHLVFSNTVVLPSATDEMISILDAIGRFNGSSRGDPRIRRIYLCTERRRKQVLSLLASVFGQGFGLIAAGLGIGYFCLTTFLGVDDRVREDLIVGEEVVVDNDAGTEKTQQ
jgi:hypothetical protein